MASTTVLASSACLSLDEMALAHGHQGIGEVEHVAQLPVRRHCFFEQEESLVIVQRLFAGPGEEESHVSFRLGHSSKVTQFLEAA